MQFIPGMIVKSDAGRDQPGYYVVIAVEDGFVYIADGRRRKVEKPKRKNPRHLKATKTVVGSMEIDTNQKLRRVLRGYQETAAPVAE